MGKVYVSITMSLDGFSAGPNITKENPLGVGGERLHDWMFDAQTEADNALKDEGIARTGAVILGKRTYADAIDDGWGGVSPFAAPAFVLAHQPPPKVVEGFTIVTDGLESALRQAKVTAGDKDVWIMGGANVIQQYIKAGLVDEIQISIAPVLFMQGTRLFEYLGTEHIELRGSLAVQTPQATHIRYEVIK